MGDWLSIILLILIGLVLIYLELLFVPGTTILGILGLILTGVGIYVTYEKHGSEAGNMVLIGSVVVSIVALYYSFKKNAWDRFSLKSENEGHVNEGYTSDLEEAMEGRAISDLKPIGKGEFNDKVYEVTTFGNLVESGDRIRIIKIKGNKIIVEQIKS